MEKRILALAFLGGLWAAALVAQEAKRDPIKMEITVTNPKDKSQKLTIKEPVPVGLTEKGDIKVPRGLDVQFDSRTSLFYIVAEEREVVGEDGKKTMERTIELGPHEIDRTYVVELEDVWYIKEDDMTGLEKQAEAARVILEGTDYRDEARAIADGIVDSFRDIRTLQTDDSIQRKEYIDSYLNRMEKLNQARAGIEEMERYIKLQQKKISDQLKTDEEMPVQTKHATWLVIFIILVFLGILTGAFYFVWQRRAHLLEGPLSEAKRVAFPESGPGTGEEDEGT